MDFLCCVFFLIWISNQQVYKPEHPYKQYLRINNLIFLLKISTFLIALHLMGENKLVQIKQYYVQASLKWHRALKILFYLPIELNLNWSSRTRVECHGNRKILVMEVMRSKKHACFEKLRLPFNGPPPILWVLWALPTTTV